MNSSLIYRSMARSRQKARSHPYDRAVRRRAEAAHAAQIILEDAAFHDEGAHDDAAPDTADDDVAGNAPLQERKAPDPINNGEEEEEDEEEADEEDDDDDEDDTDEVAGNAPLQERKAPDPPNNGKRALVAWSWWRRKKRIIVAADEDVEEDDDDEEEEEDDEDEDEDAAEDDEEEDDDKEELPELVEVIGHEHVDVDRLQLSQDHIPVAAKPKVKHTAMVIEQRAARGRKRIADQQYAAGRILLLNKYLLGDVAAIVNAFIITPLPKLPTWTMVVKGLGKPDWRAMVSPRVDLSRLAYQDSHQIGPPLRDHVEYLILGEPIQPEQHCIPGVTEMIRILR
jgi:hypothetical protein